jgi:putative acetyltransferase
MPRESLIREALASDMGVVRELMLRYQSWLGIDLCFQGFNTELQSLPGIYTKPCGNLWLAVEPTTDAALGIIAIKPLEATICEMKRLWVEDLGKGRGIGRTLANTAIAFAQHAGYTEMRLDTLRTRMPAAVSLYQSLGFVETEAYVANPEPDVVYMRLSLR